MTEISPFLKSLLSAPGLSGYEGPVKDLIAAAWEPLVDELSTSRLGSLHGLSRGSGPEPRPRLLIATHMDAIGLIVTTVVGGLLHFTRVGGVDPRILPGTRVLVHGREPLPGVVVQPPAHLLAPEFKDKPVSMAYLFVDTGLLPDEVNRLVRPGDIISFDQPPVDLTGETISGHSLDNRASVAAATICLQELQHVKHDWDVWAVATIQEEVTLGGALTSTFDIMPQLAVAVDVTFAKGPGASDYRTFPLGKGVALGMGPNIHPALYERFKDLAEELDIPYSIDPMASMSGTDAIGTQVTAEGVPTMVVSIPLRYMHTPVEVVAYKDIQRVGHLLAQFIAHLDVDYVNKITWED